MTMRLTAHAKGEVPAGTIKQYTKEFSGTHFLLRPDIFRILGHEAIGKTTMQGKAE